MAQNYNSCLWEIRMAMVRQSTLSGTWEIPEEGRSADDHVRDQYKGGTYRDLNFQRMGMGQGEGENQRCCSCRLQAPCSLLMYLMPFRCDSNLGLLFSILTIWGRYPASPLASCYTLLEHRCSFRTQMFTLKWPSKKTGLKFDCQSDFCNAFWQFSFLRQ